MAPYFNHPEVVGLCPGKNTHIRLYFRTRKPKTPALIPYAPELHIKEAVYKSITHGGGPSA